MGTRHEVNMFIDITTAEGLSRSLNVHHIVSIEIVESSFNINNPFTIRVTLINRDDQLLGPWKTRDSAGQAKRDLMDQVHSAWGR